MSWESNTNRIGHLPPQRQGAYTEEQYALTPHARCNNARSLVGAAVQVVSPGDEGYVLLARGAPLLASKGPNCNIINNAGNKPQWIQPMFINVATEYGQATDRVCTCAT
jgi:hypothetical protein